MIGLEVHDDGGSVIKNQPVNDAGNPVVPVNGFNTLFLHDARRFRRREKSADGWDFHTLRYDAFRLRSRVESPLRLVFIIPAGNPFKHGMDGGTKRGGLPCARVFFSPERGGFLRQAGGGYPFSGQRFLRRPFQRAFLRAFVYDFREFRVPPFKTAGVQA